MSVGAAFLRRPHWCTLGAAVRMPRSILLRTVRTSPSSSSAAAASSIEAALPAPDSKQDAMPMPSYKNHSLACPICYFQLIPRSIAEINLASTPGLSLECDTCKKSYFGDAYIDLTVASGSAGYIEAMPASTELFRSPLVSFLYERGWRQNFIIGGFPGPEKEFEMAKDYLRPAIGGTLVDASSGSGLFTRLFAKSGLYSLVIALDFSENMLRRCYDFIIDESIPKEKVLLVRADIARLPFVSGSINAVHAGAALHCWPSPLAAVAEISRVLQPGGTFVATTFILDTFSPAVPILRILRQPYIRATSNNIFVSEGELNDLCSACGLADFTCTRNGPFVMIAATKPG